MLEADGACRVETATHAFQFMFHLQALSRLHLKFHDLGVDEALRL